MVDRDRPRLYGDLVSKGGERRRDLGRTQHLHPDPQTGPWQLTLSWVELAGRPECVAMEIRHVAPAEGMPPLGESVLRGLNVAARIAADRARLVAGERVTEVVRPSGMRQETFERLQRVAEIYRAALARGEPPTRAVADELGVAIGTASATVSKARRVGLLPPTSVGVSLG